MNNLIILPPIKLLNQDDTLLLTPNKMSCCSHHGAIHGHHRHHRRQPNKKRRILNAQWLFFKNDKWIPFDSINHQKLEDTVFSRGTFVDIPDSHFPQVSKVRVFPELDYLSYLGIRYKISKVLLPDI